MSPSLIILSELFMKLRACHIQCCSNQDFYVCQPLRSLSWLNVCLIWRLIGCCITRTNYKHALKLLPLADKYTIRHAYNKIRINVDHQTLLSLEIWHENIFTFTIIHVQGYIYACLGIECALKQLSLPINNRSLLSLRHTCSLLESWNKALQKEKQPVLIT